MGKKLVQLFDPVMLSCMLGSGPAVLDEERDLLEEEPGLRAAMMEGVELFAAHVPHLKQ